MLTEHLRPILFNTYTALTNPAAYLDYANMAALLLTNRQNS